MDKISVNYKFVTEIRKTEKLGLKRLFVDLHLKAGL